MSFSVSNISTYAGFARRFARRFVAERIAESRTSIARAPHRPVPSRWRDEDLTVAWLGHATVLMNFYGAWILTDPVLMRRIGVRVPGIATLGLRRLVEPALKIHELPPIDAVLLSHSHFDHTDLPTLARLPKQTRIVVQRGNLDLVKRFKRVDELKWGETVEIGGARIEAIPTQHWGARVLTDRERGFGGYVIQKRGRAVVFAGDTAETNRFARLREKYPRIELAIMPIGAYNPFVHAHATPEQAWRMARDMNAERILPIHHSTFRLSREPIDEPIKRLHKIAEDERWRIALNQIGETWTLPDD
jgi:L-ascorbate metabolism protein UlaG (beta-lactamase superfamily)